MSYREYRHGSGYGGLRRAKQFHNRRSNRAKRVDEGLRAPLAKSESRWLAQPNRYDLPEVDTPKKSESEQKDEEWKTQCDRLDANHLPTSHRQFKANLNVHKYSGTGR